MVNVIYLDISNINGPFIGSILRNKEKRMNKLLLCAIIVSMTLLQTTLAGSDGGTSGDPRTIIDSAGRSITISQPIERIFPLNADAAEAVLMLGGEDKIIGISESVKKKNEYFKNLQDLPIVANQNEVNFEKISEMVLEDNTIRPNVLVVCYFYPDKPSGVISIAKGLSQFSNITVAGLDFYKPENMTDEIEKLGVLLDCERKSQDFISWHEKRLAGVENALGNVSIPRVYYEGATDGLGSLNTYGEGSGINSLQIMAKGANIAKALEGTYPKVDWEWVISENPDVIIKLAPHTGIQLQNTFGWQLPPAQTGKELDVIRESILSRPGANNISAIENGRVYVLFNDMCYGMDSSVGLTYLSKILHPEMDLNPEQIYQEYLDMLGMKLPDNATFVYPVLK
jgi:iron complex transport system substrate-binding protein